ncbi:MAG: TonB-dependent receptor [Bacteroidia bacterium]|nr:TonB-dependent receptor [Bacteroidia bacterium]
MLITQVGLCQQASIRGIIYDGDGNQLPQAHLALFPDSLIVVSDVHGKFTMRASTGKKDLRVSYTGYFTQRISFRLQNDTTLNIVLKTDVSELDEVVVSTARYRQEDVFESTRTGTITLTEDELKGIPVLGGEADLIKTLQLLPGTLRGVEGSSDIFVRGGAADQNLVLLDDAPVYNTSHLFGFLSVFNPDVVEKVEAINGGFPAQYGGRLSSILDIQTKSAHPARTKVSGDIGLIASRLSITQPLLKNKVSLSVAGRRTYVDQLFKVIGQELPYYFYDINAKLIISPSTHDQVQVSFYGGSDILDLFRDRNNDGDGMLTRFESGNNCQTIRWQHRFASAWSTHLSLIRSFYRYNISNAFEENEVHALSDIEDLGVRWQVANDSLGKFSVKTGIEWTRHFVSPSVVNTNGTIAELLESSSTNGRIANEVSAYAQAEWDVTSRWRANAGFRLSSGLVENASYINPEPRFSLRYAMDKNNTIKISYSRMVQYMQRVSSSAISSPTDIWYPVTKDIRPQLAHQYSAAWQRMIRRPKMFLSVEAYYKDMDNLIGYEEGTNLFLNTDFESKLIQGNGNAYGLEILLKKESGKFTGWISYTLSWSRRHFDEVNNGEWFYSRYDRRHNGAVVMQYALNRRWSFSLVWELISGSRFTPVVGQYVVSAPSLTGVDLIPIYTSANAVKLSDTHRLDLGVKFKSKPGRKFQWQWFAGVYNTYNRANPVGIGIEQDESDGSLHYVQPGLFGLLPFISYGFKF